jgi:hypothetical protein
MLTSFNKMHLVYVRVRHRTGGGLTTLINLLICSGLLSGARYPLFLNAAFP